MTRRLGWNDPLEEVTDAQIRAAIHYLDPDAVLDASPEVINSVIRYLDRGLRDTKSRRNDKGVLLWVSLITTVFYVVAFFWLRHWTP